MGLIDYLFGKREKVVKIPESRFVEWEKKVDQLLKDKEVSCLPTETYKVTYDEAKVKEKQFSPLNMKVVLVNNKLTILLETGEVLSVDNADKDLYNSALACTSEQELKFLLYPTLKEEADIKEQEELKIKLNKELEEKKVELQNKKKEKALQYTKYLVESGDFEIKDDDIYMKGIEVSLPQLLLNKFSELAEKVLEPKGKEPKKADLQLEYDSLKNFWRWCSLNPNPQSREDLFKFLENHDLAINKNGMFFAYRNVDSVSTNKKGSTIKALKDSEQISALYTKVKTWKKSPVNYGVWEEDGKYGIIELNKVATPAFQKRNAILHDGNLDVMYKGLSSEEVGQCYTDAYTHKMDIRIGKEVSMPREDCDSDNTQDCSRGLHVGTKNFGFDGNGDTHILVLINPMNAVSIPTYNSNKMRVCAYLPVCVLDSSKEGKFLENAVVTELGNDYFVSQVNNLAELVEKSSPKEIVKKNLLKTYINEDITKAQTVYNTFEEKVVEIVNAREQAKSTISKRVIKK